MVKLFDHVAKEERLNTKLLYLKQKIIFSSAKKKLNLNPGDDNNSHSYDCETYLIPKQGNTIYPSENML